MNLFWLISPATAQNVRLTENNTIGWYTNTTNIRLSERWSGHVEYQFRRDDLILNWQQSLLRTAVGYQVNERLALRVGHAWVETFAYGTEPIQAAGRQFPEHRIYQMATLNNPVGRVDINHRFMLEQRWVGRFLRPASPRPDETVYSNRLRYMFRAQLPLNKPVIGDRTFYAAAYNEVFVGFGKNVNENVFDQNRLGLLVGYRFNRTFRLEGGYLKQILQFPREVSGRNVFQYNNGLIVNTMINLDLRRKE